MMNLMAYIDPASTALIWQILAGVFITLGVVLGIWWTKITTFIKTVWVKIFGGKKKDGKADAAEVEADKELDDELEETTEAEEVEDKTEKKKTEKTKKKA